VTHILITYSQMQTIVNSGKLLPDEVIIRVGVAARTAGQKEALMQAAAAAASTADSLRSTLSCQLPAAAHHKQPELCPDL
jgi:hypothetical protein